ncbi:DUF1287 domain-containing protein [Phenylobacterium sp.]|uniref:DUF1287 domain-containing protein n=1 Tax=Phenylobacterium sp. TaxID=1871053 RepID=UPI00272443A9|nr:DUF1287 domain-containing protein [Phenylobacterium sp.]MDO8800816.1 DUF1287 domain-containing protein [Phenylobacterium sp.]
MSTRRALIGGLMAAPAWALAAGSPGDVLARAARAQVGVTTDYDPAYVRLAYPGGDVPRTTGVCCDVVIRAARDAWKADLQRLIHEDMTRHFGAYPQAWRLAKPDTHIDHRRVLNLETYWARIGAQVWRARGPAFGQGVPGPLAAGDILTWRLSIGDRPHVGIVVTGGDKPRVVHNIGQGARDESLADLWQLKPVGHYRWRPTA